MKLACALALLAACWTGAPPSEPSAAPPAPKARSGKLVVTDTGVGPIGGTFKLSPSAIRQALRGYRLELERHDEDTVLFNIHDAVELLFYIVPYTDCRPFGIHVVSSRVDVAAHGWRVGVRLPNAGAITACECWGGETRTCYRTGERVAVVFDQTCEDDSKDNLETLAGATIKRVVWQPEPWGETWTMSGGTDEDCTAGESPP